MSLDSLPRVSQAQLDQMNKIAQEKYGVQAEEVVAQPQEAPETTPEEIADQTQEASAEDQQTPPQQLQETPVAKPTAYSKEENMALLRERARKAEAERQELARQLESFQKQSNPSNSKSPDLAPDDFAEGKHIAALQQKINMIEAEARLRYRYPDFDKVMSQSNVASLAEMYPDIARTISQSNSDPYSQAVTAYTMIKNLGIHADDFQQDKKIAATNAAKPRPLTSISPTQGDTPLSRANAFANGLTDDLRKSLQKEMFEAMKNRY